MKVSELIERLSKLDADLEVEIFIDMPECVGESPTTIEVVQRVGGGALYVLIS